MRRDRSTGQRSAPGRAAIAITTAAAAATLAGGVMADVTKAIYTNSNNFEYRVLHMPDLDQRRTALPNNGAMYCAPTAAINLFAYAANHGYPIAPGSGNWQSSSKYNQASSAISTMGALMGTTPTGGTGGSGAANGYIIWKFQNPMLAYIGYKKSSNYTPTAPKMAKLATQGWIISFAYGRYDVIGSVGGAPKLDRTGGHVVSLAGAFALPTFRLLRYRDPASDSASLTSQSTFSDRFTNFENIPVAFSNSDIRIMSAIDYPSDDGKIRLIDSYRAIRPAYAFFFVNTGDAVGGGSIKLLDPAPFEGAVNLQLPSIPVSPFVSLLDIAMHPDQTEALIVTKSIFVGVPSQLRLLDLFEGTSAELPNSPGGLERICVGRKGDIFGFDDGGKLYRLDANTGDILNAISSNPTPTEVAPDDTTDSIWLLSIPQRRLVRYSTTLSQLNNWVMPTPIPMSGDGAVAVDPANGRPYFVTDASDSIFGVTQLPNGALDIETISIPEIQNPEAIQFGPSGEMMVVGDGSVKVLRQVVTVGAGTVWQLDPTSPFHGEAAGVPFLLSGNRDNHDPAEHDVPGWADIPVTELADIGFEVADCAGDVNDDGVVNGADIALVLGAWATSDNLADLNFDGIVNGQDIAVVLGGWGDCP